ncbi:MAG: ECF transporter S component [Firmicutes bacterium]|nr:ECF transporter S component [Bacillota bacterium]
MLKTNTKKVSVRKLTIVGVLAAISALLGLTPLGFIPVGPVKYTIMHIPVIIGAIIEGPIVGILVGLMFGIFSIINAVINFTPISPIFFNPLVSVLPRVLIGITAYYSYVLFKRMGRKASITTLVVIWTSTLVYLSKTFITQIISYEAGMSIWQVSFRGVLILVTLLVGFYSYKRLKDHAIEVVIAAAIGTLTNTIGVLFMIYKLYGETFVEKIGGNTDLVGKVILGIGLTNGIPETIIAMLIVTSVVVALKKQ